MTQYIKHSFGVYRQGVTNGSPIVLDGPTDISLNIDQQSILKISRVGDDLVVYLVDGQQVVLEGFFLSTTGLQENRLFTSVDGEIQEVELGERYGLFNTAEYNPLDVYDDGLLFDGSGEQSLLFETKTAAVGGAGNLGVIAGGVAGIGLLGALAGGGGSSSQENSNSDAPPVTTGRTDTDGTQSPAAADTVDAVAPTAPVIQIANASQISGTGEPGASVGVDVNGDGVSDLTTTVAGNGTWSVTPNPALADGTLVTARQTDPDGNQSLATTDMVDAVAPVAPYVDVSSDGTQIIGSAEPNAEVSVSYIGSGNQIITLNPIIVSGTGSWNTVPNPTLAANEDIYVQVEDTDGNESAYTLVLQGTDDGIINFNSLSGDIAIGVAAFDIESIDLSDDTSNALIISETNLQSLSTGSDNLRVDGVTGNGVTASGASANGTTIINGETYNIYEFAGGGQLQIDQDVMVIV